MRHRYRPLISYIQQNGKKKICLLHGSFFISELFWLLSMSKKRWRELHIVHALFICVCSCLTFIVLLQNKACSCCYSEICCGGCKWCTTVWHQELLTFLPLCVCVCFFFQERIELLNRNSKTVNISICIEAVKCQWLWGEGISFNVLNFCAFISYFFRCRGNIREIIKLLSSCSLDFIMFKFVRLLMTFDS